VTDKSKARASRREAARRRDRGSSASRWLIPVVVVIIVGAAALAFVLGQSGGTAVADPTPVASVGPPVVTGTPLPRFSATTDDPAIGSAAPTVQGHDDRGNPVSIEPTGKPTLVIFAAHWCPHCQREVPVIQAWIDGGGVPAGVELRSVSTAIDPTQPNYPPAAWFEDVGWTVPVIVDSTNSVAEAYGLSAYPFFVMLDGDGKVVRRLTGELAPDALAALIGSATGN
jgi:thiol-disulfide isomerase/thioredoxin